MGGGTMRQRGGWPIMSKDHKPNDETPQRGWPMKESDEPWRGANEPDQKPRAKPDLEKWQETSTH
jgi:hypothetical protein